jgi:GH25 family lysozyme M1 (1,4-beta-N-acetylmuramidase)
LYYFEEDGKVFKGEREIKGDLYYFSDKKGVMLKDKEQNVGENWYDYQADGKRFGAGWMTHSDGRKVYYDAEDGMLFGEQTVDGDKYFFNISTGGILTGTTYYQGYKYTIGKDGIIQDKEKMKILKGVDVSSHQTSKIDWAKVAASGVQFVIVRAGYITEHEEKIFVPDKQYVRNVLEAQKNGISVGSYIYLYSYTEGRLTAGIAEFDEHTTANRLKFDLPVFLDVEDEKNLKAGSDELGGYEYRTDLVRGGMEDLAGLGYKPGFYTFLRWANNEIDAEKLFKEGYPLWIANWYKNDAELEPSVMAWNKKYPSLWQYRDTGSVDGIPTAVDMDYLYLDIMPEDY